MPNPKSNADSKNSNADSKSGGDSKNSGGDSKNNNADLKHSNSESKSYRADSKISKSDSKNNNADSKIGKSDSKSNKADWKNIKADSKNDYDSKTNADAREGDVGGDNLAPQGAQSAVGQCFGSGNKVYKSGPLFLSSKGIGWTSWKKRWFVLTESSLVFFRSDPNAASQKGGEVNLTLGGIDLNSSGSVVVKADKKLLTVLFPDGRDGRAFTLKAETTEDLYEWKSALEEALANAPSAATGTGQNGMLNNDKGDTADGSEEQSKDQQPAKSIVLGRPILLALEDIDGTPSFLEKALRYVEDYGVKVEGILRQAADVEAVERRIREYEQGKVEFTEAEDAHVIGDCIKYVLRELPSSPVPASCCKALLEAYRSDRATRVSAMRAAICDTFPEPNRRLLQRLLEMMEVVAENKAVNRMSVSAVAACMSPLLLRPLLNGEVDLGGEHGVGGDSVQLLQAAAAANHAQAIVITLLESYDKMFGEGDVLSDLYDDSEDDESEELSDEYSEDDDYEDDEDNEDDEDEDGEYTSEGSQADEDSENGSRVSGSETEEDRESPQRPNKGSGGVGSNSSSHEVTADQKTNEKHSSSTSGRSLHQYDKLDINDKVSNQFKDHSATQANEPAEHSKENKSKESTENASRPHRFIRGFSSRRKVGAKKKLPAESIDVVLAEQDEILRLEATKAELKEKIEAEVKKNAVLKEDLLMKKNALEERRIHLKQEVTKLQDQLQKQRESQGAVSSSSNNEKTKGEQEDTSQAEEADDSNYQPPQSPNQGKSKDKDKDRDARKNKLDSARSSKGETNMSKSSSGAPKRSNSRSEAAGSTSALSKITNRLNFLKEKRNQIADELQYIDKDPDKIQPSQKHTETHNNQQTSTDKGRSEDQSTANPNQDR